MREHAFGAAHAADDGGDALARLAREPLVGDRLEELADPQPARVAGGAAGRQRVVGADALVAVGDRAFLADEQAAVVAQARQVVVVASRLHLEVLRRVGVAEGDRGVVILDDRHLAPAPPGSAGHLPPSEG